MAYPMTQWGQGNRPVMVPRQPDFMEQIAPTLLNFLGQYGLQKASQGFRAGQAEAGQFFKQGEAIDQRDFLDRQQDKTIAADIEKARLAEERKYRSDIDKEIIRGNLSQGSLKAGQAGAPAPGEKVAGRGSPFGGTWVPTPEYKPRSEGAWLRGKEAGVKPSEGESDIIRLMQASPNMTYADAVKISQGAVKPTKDVLGRPALLDLTTGTVKSIGQGAAAPSGQIPTRLGAQPVEPTPSPPSFGITPGMADAGIGPRGKTRQVINNFFGWMTPGVPFTETAEARGSLEQFNEGLIQNFVKNPKVPVAEQERIRKFLPKTDKFFTDPDEAKIDMVRLKDSLFTMRRAKERLIRRGKITASQQQTFRDQINRIDENLMMMADVPSYLVKTEQQRINVPVGEVYMDSKGQIFRKR